MDEEYWETLKEFDIDTEEDALVFLGSVCFAAIQMNAIEHGEATADSASHIIAAGLGGMMKSPLWHKYGSDIIEAGNDIVSAFVLGDSEAP